MLSIIAKHWIYDQGLSILFDNLISNFQVYVPSQYLDRWWIAIDKEDGDIICWGKCMQHEKNMVVLDDTEDEFIVHVDLYRLEPAMEAECDLLNNNYMMNDEELVDVLNGISDH